MTENSLDVRWKWLILVAAIGFVLYLLGPVLSPFVAAALFAYLFNPLVEVLERRGVGRAWGVSLVFIVLTLALVGIVLVLIPFIERQIANFLEQLPRWTAWAQNVASPWVEAHLGISLGSFDSQGIVGMLQAHWKEAGGFAAAVVAGVSKSGFAVLGWVLNAVIVPVAAFYLLRDWNIVVDRVHALIPRSIEPVVVRLARESDETLGGFLRGQLSVMIVLGIIYGLGLWMVGISVGPLIGMIAGLISFVPYLGAIVGVGMGIIAALVQYQDWFHVLLVLAVFAIGQTLEGYVLVPKLVGDRIGMHPVAVMFAILAGGQLFGFVGVLLALPIAAIVMVLLRYAYERYTQSEMYQDVGEEPQIVVAGDLSRAATTVVATETIIVTGHARAQEPPAKP
ncbi:AI-2E family transporter [Dokdonella koreensis]|uniref:Permease n=1 Tax=Dokdonella koreensis DS-123 TaxID=1300342 RepID=A0A160DTY8_9GAMM|nr:AI-2E family transporter [Dokdonella koreensis]ANB17875.1 Putative permease [Dokdonella koreensis DS-123]